MRAWLLVLWSIGCAIPVPIERRDYVLGQIASRYGEFADSDTLLLEPRFGLPALVERGKSFDLVVMERNHATVPAVSLCREKECVPVTIDERRATPVGNNCEEVRYSAHTDAKKGGWDLRMGSQVAPRAVWLSDDDPAAPRPLRVVQLSDLHIGKGVAHIEDHLAQVIYDVNALQPDVVIVTGDLSNVGTEKWQLERARQFLLRLTMPVVVVIGNHDIGFTSLARVPYGRGWPNFARVFHASLMFQRRLDGWLLVGLDSGPSTFSPRVETRGFYPGAVEAVRQIVAADVGRGVLLFSHAPTRTSLHGDGPGLFGHVKWGGPELERVMLDAAARGTRVIHLAGHTHWSDLFESAVEPDAATQASLAPPDDHKTFHRWHELSPCAKPITGRAILITTQAADHPGIKIKETAAGWGFTELALDAGPPIVTFHRYGLPDDPWICR